MFTFVNSVFTPFARISNAANAAKLVNTSVFKTAYLLMPTNSS